MNAKTKSEQVQKRASCTIHQNRSKRQKKDIDYLELNVGRGCAQPRNKPKTKKMNIVMALREPSETCLAAHQIQLERQNSQPGQILGLAIKTEIKSETGSEQDHRNTRHRYKSQPLTGNINYIHPDGTPCRSSMRKEAELPDLPNMDNQEQNTANGLQVETLTSQLPTNTDGADMSVEKNVSETGLPVELPKTSDLCDTDNTLMNTSNNNVRPIPEVNVTKKQNDLPVETVADTLVENITDKQNDLPVETVEDTQAEKIAGKVITDVNTTSQDLMDVEPGNNSTTYILNGSSVENNKNKHKTDATEMNTEMNMLGSENENNNELLEKYDNSKILPVNTARQVDYGLDPNTDALTPSENKKTLLGTNTIDDANSSYDSDDTILLEQEIAEAIGVRTGE